VASCTQSSRLPRSAPAYHVGERPGQAARPVGLGAASTSKVQIKWHRHRPKCKISQHFQRQTSLAEAAHNGRRCIWLWLGDGSGQSGPGRRPSWLAVGVIYWRLLFGCRRRREAKVLLAWPAAIVEPHRLLARPSQAPRLAGGSSGRVRVSDTSALGWPHTPGRGGGAFQAAKQYRWRRSLSGSNSASCCATRR
jgi:hypothetical protein